MKELHRAGCGGGGGAPMPWLGATVQHLDVLSTLEAPGTPSFRGLCGDSVTQA